MRLAIANGLNRLVRKTSTGAELRDRLASCCTQFDQLGTTVDAVVLRREAHTLLEAAAVRTRPGWGVLTELDQHSHTAPRSSPGPGR